MSGFDARHGSPVTVADGIVRTTANNAGPFTGAGTNTYLLGERRLMVVDPGPDDPAHVAAILAAAAGRPVTHILVTHTHRDHVGALAALKAATGATTVAEGPHREARPLKAGETNPFLSSSDMAFRPDVVLRDREVIDNGEVAVAAIATPGHTANHLAFGVGDVCLTGDHVMGWSTTVIAPPDGSMAAYMASLDRLLAEPHRLYLPGHGGAIEEPHRAVSAMRSHRLMREAAILARLREGDRTADAVVEALYAGIDPRLRRAAGLSVLAHLEKLSAEGRVAAEGFGPTAVWTPG
jgi:glyoxylase-like metal-dependent hydrolase (beta-lactamase superfamily II)